ncbi:MAG: vWA domain-containing protein [Archangium sp.]|nr:vWA domain-containing protein [Archangium sp.]MDP3572375.1 vWA domain-containing protein [Archangium sp.]
MTVDRFNQLKDRLDALREGRPPDLGFLSRAKMMFLRDDGKVTLDALRALDTELERAGVHTVADARLLRELGSAKGKLGELSVGLRARADASLTEFELALSEAERMAALEVIPADLRSTLELDFRRLGRVVKVAAVFDAANVPFEIFNRPRTAERLAPTSARLALAEFFSERAQKQTGDTTQKRRDLDLAYEIVLRMGADAKGDRDRSRRLRLELGAARERVRASPAVRSLDDLIRHVRHAARRDPSTAWRSLRALYERAIEAGDAELAQTASAALLSISEKGALAPAVDRAEAMRSIGWRDGPREERLAPGGKKGLDDQLASELAKLAFELDDDERKALELAAGCARYFDVEDSLAEEIVEAEIRSTRPVQRRVPYPTQLMTYEPTNSLDQLNHFVLDHPGSLVLDLASGRQMVRAYLEEQPPPRPKKSQKTAVRVYVLDASGSMHGSRARFRDAILVSELNAIRVRAKAGLPFDPLYFSFFNDAPTELVRIDSGDAASRHIDKLFRESPAEGQTDISLALVSAFDSIGRARGEDPYLARATVVLVTDGEDGVELELIRKTRRPYEGLEIALSFISLGEENPDLRSLIVEQRDAGGRAFYHHVSDAEIQLARTDFDSAWRTLLPADVAVTSDALEKLVPHLEALEAIAQGRPVHKSATQESQFDALFPETPRANAVASAQLPRVVDVLEAIAEAVSLAPTEGRRAEAVTLLTHLLQVYGMPLPKYLEWVQVPEVRLQKAVARIRLVC